MPAPRRLLDKPAFKNAFRRRRCLIPADGYYEWSQSEARKRPYFIHPRDGQPFGFAGLAETWTGPNGEELDTVAIVTTAASADLAVLHPRVPVTMTPGDFDRWLDCANDEIDAAMALLAAPDEGEFLWHQVSTRVNRVANDDAQLILPISAEEAAAEEAQPAKKTAQRKPVARHRAMTGRGRCFDSSCPALCRASTSFLLRACKTWMAGTSPAMTAWRSPTEKYSAPHTAAA